MPADRKDQSAGSHSSGSREEAADPPGRKRVRPGPLLVGALSALTFTTLAVGAITFLAGGQEVFLVLRQIDRGGLAAGFGIQVAALACLTQVYRAAHRAAGGGRLGLRASTTVSLGAFVLTQILPGGGAAGAVYAVSRLRRRGSSPVIATATVALVGMISLTALCLVVTVAATLAAATDSAYRRFVAVALAATLAVLLVAVLLYRSIASRRVRAVWSKRLSRFKWRHHRVPERWLNDLAQHVDLLTRPGPLVAAALWGAAKWSLDFAVLAVMARAAGAEVPLIAVALAYAAANLLNNVPLTPGGTGLVEGGIAATLIIMGTASATAAVIVLAYRTVAHWLPAAIALPLVGVRLVRESMTEARAASRRRPSPS